MLTIRLTRKGKKNQSFFRVVVIDKRRSSKGGRTVEDVGYKNPLTKKISLNKDRILHWIKNGAQPSATVHNILVAEKIIDAKKVKNSNISKKKLAEIAKAKTDAEVAEKAKAEQEAKAKADAEAAAAKVAENPAPAEPQPESKPEETPAVEAPKEESKPEEKLAE